MEPKKPLKRAIELQTLSHDHYHALHLCTKIGAGLSKNIAPERIKLYANWFFETHLIPHFKLEEELVFTVLEPENKLVQRALTEHQNLIELFCSDAKPKEILEKIAVDLKAHIRFEERELFTEVQKIATAVQLQKINAAHTEEVFVENKNDTFWL